MRVFYILFSEDGMQVTGIIRRIDDLGRIVIPKELRKSLRIREGDPLEIFTNKEELVFKKFSPIALKESNTAIVIKEIATVLERTCMAIDNDKIISVSNSKYKEIIGAFLSDKMIELLNKRTLFNACRGDGVLPIKVYKGDEEYYENQIIAPIITNGDCFGAVIVFDSDKSKRLNVTDEKIVQLGASFIASQFEM